MSFLGHLFGAPMRATDPVLRAAVERAVDKVDPRLRQMGGFPGRYQDVVASGYAYAVRLAGSIPGPIAVDPEHFASDSTVHAMFGSLQDLRAAMCLSQAMREYIQIRPDAREVYALLGMRRFERKTLGIELDGELLRREVPQTVVYFADHTLSDPASTEADVRDKVIWGLFDRLVAQVAQRIEARKLARCDLENQRDRLLAQLHSADARAVSAIQAELETTRKALQDVVASLEFSRYIEDFSVVLGNPEQFIHLENVAMQLDNMGILRGGIQSSEVREVCFTDLVGGDRRRWTLTLVHCQEIGVPSMAERLKDASRWMAI